MNILRNTKIKIFLTVFLVYLFYIAPGYITAGTNRYLDLTKAIVDDGTFRIDKYFQNTRDWAYYKDHYYAGAAPGLSFMAVPIYIASKPFLKLIPENIYNDQEHSILNMIFALFLAVLPGSLIAVLLYNLLGYFNLKEREKILIVFASSFGTILFFYSTRFMAHVAASFMLFSAFYILFQSRQKPKPKILYFLAGLCAGFAVLTEYILIVGSSLLLIYALLWFGKKRSLHYMCFAAGLSLTIVSYMYYHYTCFGNPFITATYYGQMVGPFKMCFPPANIMYDLSFGTYRGLFLYMPVTLLSLYGIFIFFKKPNRDFLSEILFITVYSLIIFAAIPIDCSKFWPIGGDFGPRYFICFLPFLMLPIAYVFRAVKYKIIFGISLISIFINWCGIQYGDADSVFTDIGLFIFMGLNSNLAEWGYKLTDSYIRKLNVITHFSPLIGFCVLLIAVYLIWKKELDGLGLSYFSGMKKA